LINGVYEPTGTLHHDRGVWVSRAVRPLYIFHTGKSRWVVSKRIDDGAKCYAFLSDSGSDPTKAQASWTCCDTDGEWRADPCVVLVQTPASNDKFVLLRMTLDQEMDKYELNDPASLKQLWKRLDVNGNGKASLAELDKLVVDMVAGKTWPEWLNNKQALMRAFHAADLLEGDGDGWVEACEFHALLLDVWWFNKLWKIFDVIDTGHDHRIDASELARGLGELGLSISTAEAAEEFKKIDANHDGGILFVEFCAYARQRLNPDSDPHADADIACGEHGGKVPPRGKAGRQARVAAAVAKGDKAAAGSLAPPVAGAAPSSVQQGAAGISRKSLAAFSELETAIKALMSDQTKLKGLWRKLDFNGNNVVSLAEIDKMVVETYPLLDHKPALIRAYKATCQAVKKGSDGEDFVHKKEFKTLLGNILYFNKIFWLFDHVDEGGDRRLNYEEFAKLLSIAGAKMPEKEMRTAFSQVDKNGGGIILFDEFCAFFTQKACPECLSELID